MLNPLCEIAGGGLTNLATAQAAVQFPMTLHRRALSRQPAFPTAARSPLSTALNLTGAIQFKAGEVHTASSSQELGTFQEPG